MTKDKKASQGLLASDKEYKKIFAKLKKQIQAAQVKAALSVNKELIKLYWLVGKTIAEKQETAGWGSAIIEKLAKDLQTSFPGVAGFSKVNIFRMQAFYRAYEKVSQLVTQKAITNFVKTLPSPHSDMAQQSLKDPYLFDFLTLQEKHLEKDVEQGLIDHIQSFLLELGKDFAFVGRQFHIEVDGDDYYLDLLFYHLKLRCYAVIELKNTEFKPEYAGKLNFYLSAVDDLLRHKDDAPTIGLLLCKTKKNFTVEYALRDINKPMGVAEYETKLVESLPKSLKSSLPTIEEIESELAGKIIKRKRKKT